MAYAILTSTESGANSLTDINANFALTAPLVSPALTGIPTAPTASVGTNTTQLATTAFVLANVASPSITISSSQTPSVITTVGQKLVIHVKGEIAVAYTGSLVTVTTNMKINGSTVDTSIVKTNPVGGNNEQIPISFLYYAIPGAQTNSITFDQTITNLVTIMTVYN